MQRLTENDGKGNWQLKGLPWEELAPGKELTAEACQLLYGALCKLKDLEAAGLYPKSAEAIDWLYLQKCKEVNELKKKMKWRPITGSEDDELPRPGEYVIVSFHEYPLMEIGLYREGEGWGAFYPPDDSTVSLAEDDAFVSAWMPLPEPYRSEGSGEYE